MQTLLSGISINCFATIKKHYRRPVTAEVAGSTPALATLFVLGDFF
jgi:hypothetical protein